MRFGLNTETVLVASIIAVAFLLITVWIQDEADASCGTMKDILSGIGISIDIANTILMVAIFLTVVYVLLSAWCGGDESDNQVKEVKPPSKRNYNGHLA